MSIELGFILAVGIVVGGAWVLTAVMAFLKHRDKPTHKDLRHA